MNKFFKLFKVNSSNMRYLAYSQPNPVSLKTLNKIKAEPKNPLSCWQSLGVDTSKIGSVSYNLDDILNMPL